MTTLHHPRRAFTLIELMVTTVIIALLGVSSYPALSRAQKNQQVKVSLELLQSCFQQGQQKARAASNNQASIDVVYNRVTKSCSVSGENNVLLPLPQNYTMSILRSVSQAQIVRISTAPPHRIENIGFTPPLEIRFFDNAGIPVQGGEIIINTDLGTVI